MTDAQKESLAKLDVAESVTLDCCNDPKEGVTNCPKLVRLQNDSFAVVGDDGAVVQLNMDQFVLLLDEGNTILDNLE